MQQALARMLMLITSCNTLQRNELTFNATDCNLAHLLGSLVQRRHQD